MVCQGGGGGGGLTTGSAKAGKGTKGSVMGAGWEWGVGVGA